MSRRHLFLALAALALALPPLGCGGKWNDPAIPASPQNDIVPFAVGNRWTYVDSTFNRSNGAFLATDSTRWDVTRHELLDVSGRVYDAWDYTRVNPVTGVADTASLVLGTVPNGLYLYGGRSPRSLYLPGRRLLYRYPANLNDSWVVNELTFDGANWIFSSDSIYQCSAPATTFDSPRLGNVACTEYNHGYYFFYANDPNHSHRFDRRSYYKPGVGYLGMVEVLDGVVIHTRRLKQFVQLATGPAAANRSALR